MPITAVPGIKVGHSTDLEGITGCTVILSEKGAVAGVDQRGGGPGTREIALLNPVNHVEKVHAVLLSGGSAFGLDAASGVMKYLEERNRATADRCSPAFYSPAAILFDLNVGDPPAPAWMVKWAIRHAPQCLTRSPAGRLPWCRYRSICRQSAWNGTGHQRWNWHSQRGNWRRCGRRALSSAVMQLETSSIPKPVRLSLGCVQAKKGLVKIGRDDLYADSLEILKTMARQTLLQSCREGQYCNWCCCDQRRLYQITDHQDRPDGTERCR